MQTVNDCFQKIKKDYFKFISSQETKKDKFKNKDKMIKSFLIPVSFWIVKRITHHNPRANPAMTGFNLGCVDEINTFELENVAVNDGQNHPLDNK